MDSKDKSKPRKRDGLKAFFKSSSTSGRVSPSASALVTPAPLQRNKQTVQTNATTTLQPAPLTTAGPSVNNGPGSSSLPIASAQTTADDNEEHL